MSTIEVRYFGDAEVTAALIRKINARVRQCMKKFPNFAEGSLCLGGVEHFFVYNTNAPDPCVYVLPRDDAERMLNGGGMTTHEPFNPLPGSERPC